MRALLILACSAGRDGPLAPAVRAGGPAALRRRPARDELVKDPVCQTYVVMSRAIREEAGGAPAYFCSRECAARFHQGERRA